jgi:NRPS condensation-like uncharacterized protein
MQQKEYKREYPLYTSIKIRHSNLGRIKARATRYNQTVDDIVTVILGRLEYYEKLGYNTQ